MNAPAPSVLKQHLIDPVICIRCNTCEETCPIKAITHDSRNYVVDPDICNGCGACISPCPTGSIDNWRSVIKAEAYSLDAQLSWDELPEEVELDISAGSTADEEPGFAPPPLDSARGSTMAPKSAATPSVNLHTIKQPAVATVVGNFRVTATDHDSDTHHIVLDFGSQPFPVLEGQSIGIIPPGTDAHGRRHHARQYSIASPRDGERPKYNNLSLTVKRVLVDHSGQPVRGVASNYVCDLQKGDQVKVIGPFGSSFLMPDDAKANLLMICTGTGSAPMRGMTERRRRLHQDGDGQLMLFFGARSQEELPYFGPLMKLPKTFIDINLAFSRTPGQPRTYVQDLMRARAADIAALLKSDDTYLYVCGLKGMEDGVIDALRYAADQHGLDWRALHPKLKAEGRLHLETY
ncbi:benzoyl-CoA 2,3-epoxidase subunit BoxA [uncultured Nevskia sp.]|uniref:benzoyl-CoA 2,3-epoxidase subunit BoxA n=1 Tax=uncultured Nevskia sp. TaxID=228950 RepID=UPI0025DD05B8|nr:benzoyl-CoA 2,3-epoxidase subunit BoxA [uncultured Nevskia sp.]